MRNNSTYTEHDSTVNHSIGAIVEARGYLSAAQRSTYRAAIQTNDDELEMELRAVARGFDTALRRLDLAMAR